jgi:hypothetical protein
MTKTRGEVSEGLTSEECTILAEEIVRNGYSRLSGDTFLGSSSEEVAAFQESYFRLPADADGGQRFRAYSRFCLRDRKLILSETQDYAQSAEYNYTHGGKVRRFAPIESQVLNLDLLQRIINTDAAITKATGLVPFGGPVRIGLHQVRYCPSAENPSYSAPPWIHKDDEPVVFVHLVNLSANVVGGDSIIAIDNKTFEAVIGLEHPLDTLCVTQQKFHAVTPVGIRAGSSGFRDILLVTFEPEGQ